MPPSILIVDDNQEATELFKELLDMQGYAVRTAHTGQQALDLVAQEASSIFLVDLNLPDIHGSALAPRLRAGALAHGVARTVVIAVTGMAQGKGDETEMFDHVLLKPVDFDKFDQLLSKCSNELQGGA